VVLTEKAFTVVVANDDEDGLLARDLAHRWHADGLLDEFAWVTPSDVTKPTYGPATVMAAVMRRDEQVELMTLLGARPRSLIRVVVLHLLTHENSSAKRLISACDEIADLVERAMPVQVSSHNGQRATRLLRVNLMVPESDLLSQETDIIEPGWEVNAIVSPEDRPDLDRMNVFVRRSVNLHGHGLAAAASVGGLWRGIAVGAFDDYGPDSTTGGREVMVIRSTARVLIGDDRSPELVDKVIEAVQGSDAGAMHLVSWGVPADNPQVLIETSVQRLLSRRDWAPQEREIRPLEKTQFSLGTILKNWAIFQLLLPVASVKYLLGLGRNVVEQSVTAATVGRGAGEVGRLRPLTPDQAEEVAKYRMKQMTDQLTSEQLREEASSWGQTTPAAWRELRELAIGLVDGSPLPAGFTRNQRAGLDEVVPPSFVVPPPWEKPPLAGHEEIHPLDVHATNEAEQQLAAQEQGAAAPSEAAPDEQVGATDTAEAEDKEPAEQERLAAWIDERKNSLMWQMVSRVNDFRRREAAQAENAHQTLANARTPSTGRLRFARLLVTLSWLATILAVVLLGPLIWSTVQKDPVWLLEQLPEVNWRDVTRIVLIVLALLFAAGTFYFQRLRAYEWQVTQRIHSLRQASDDYVAARQQEKRWAIMCRGLQDWGEILGELLHRPWTHLPPVEQEVGEYQSLPAAVAVAVPVGVDTGPDQRIVVRTAEFICQRGWLADEFHRILDHSSRNDPSMLSLSGDMPADLDLGLRPNGPRRELVEAAATPEVKLDATRHLIGDITELLSHGNVRLPTQTVVRLGPYSVGDEVPDTEFLTASSDVDAPLARDLFDAESLVMGYNVPERVVLCLPMGATPPSMEKAHVHSCGTSAAMRVDISPLLRASGIRLFADSHRMEQYVPPDDDDFN
jgi:hypothetical protein